MNKRISKRILALVLSGMLVLPMVGCESEFSLFSISSKDKTQVEEFNKFGKQTTHTDEQAVDAIITGHYTLTYNNQEYTVPMSDVLNTLLPNCEIYTQAIDENTWLVKFQSGEDYIIFIMIFLDGSLVEQELCYEGITLTEDNNQAHQGMLELIVRDIIDGGSATNDKSDSESTLECKHCGKEYKKSQSDASEPDKYCSSGCNTEASMIDEKKKEEEAQKKAESNKVKCKWCGNSYNPKDSNAWEPENFCSKSCHAKYQEKQEAKQQKTCKWCGTNKLPAGAGDNDKCSECQQESWNWHCNDCNKSMSLSEYNSTGRDTGFCPSCYEKYKQATQNTETDHKHYYCDRCGQDVTGKNFLQNIDGYDFLCERCLIELGY